MNYKYYLDKGYSVLTIDGKMDRNKEIDILVENTKYSHACGPKVIVECNKCSVVFETIVETINHQIRGENTCYCKNCNDSISAKERVKVINPGGKNELLETDIDNLCSGGCDMKATHKSNIRKFWCNNLGGIKCSGSQKRAVETFKNKDCNKGEKKWYA